MRPSWVRYRVLSWLILAAALAYLTRNSIGVAESTIRAELGLDTLGSGGFMSAFMWAYALFQIPGGLLCHYWGVRKALAAMAIGWSLATLLLSVARNLETLIAAQFLMGATQAGIFACSSTTIGHWMTQRRRSLASGAMGAGMQIGAIIAAVLTGLLLLNMSWRSVFAIYAIPGLLWAVWFSVRFRNLPEEDPAVNEAELKLIRSSAGPGASAPRAEPEPTPWLAIMTSGTMWCLCIQHFCRAAGYAFFANWFPSFLQESRGVSIKGSGYLQGVLLTALLLGCLSGGIVIDWVYKRTGSLRLSRSGVGALGQALCAAAILSAFLTEDLAGAMALIAVGAFLTFAGGTAALVMPIDIGGRHVPVVWSVMNMVGSFGGACGALVIGYIFKQTRDWNIVLLLYAGIYLIAAVCFAFTNPNKTITRERPHEDHPG